ncbi:MAG: hypothetical protein KDE58_34200, partial [Caldilineaceae bacterium]|nr:hypothetical protein [Caldilineaceae bacterium]
MKHKSPLSRLSSVLLIVGLLFLLLWPSLVQAVPLTVRQELLSAWQLAGQVGQYQYRSTVIQTTYPTAKLENVGRNPKTKRMVIEGTLDTPRDYMAMQLRNARPGTSSTNGGQLIDLKVEEGLAYGRMDTTSDWQRLADAGDLFAPGSNPLGFLVAAEDVEEITATGLDTQNTEYATDDLEPVNSLLDGSRFTFHASQGYSFNLNGLAYAGYMRGQMEEQLRRNGELPAGLRLGMVRDYIDMDGSGEIWLNADGLPVRQTMHVKFPPERGALSWYEVEIVTEYHDWGTLPGAKLAQLWHDPTTVISNPAVFAALLPTVTPDQAQQLGLTLSLLMLMGGAAAFLIAHRRSPRLYASLASAVMIAMIVGPLFQTQQASAFYDRQQEKQLTQQEEQAKQQELETIQADLSNADFDPQRNPLANTEYGSTNLGSQFTIHNSQFII